MITGSVTPGGGEAMISLYLASPGRRDRFTNVQEVIDTGFTDWLTLPMEMVRCLEPTPEREAITED